MKKVIRLTESDLMRLVKRVIREEQTAPTGGTYLDYFDKDLKVLLNSLQGTLRVTKVEDIQKVYNYCKVTTVKKQTNTDMVADLIYSKLSGGDNPINPMGGGSVTNSANVIKNYIKGSTELCALLKYYNKGGENFYTAVSGDSTYKLNTDQPLSNMIDAFIYSVNKK